MRATGTVLVLLVCGVLAACGDTSDLPPEAAYGPSPTLPEPRTSSIPTIKIAEAQGWQEGAKPEAAPGLSVAAFARDLDHPRWLYVLPNGDVLVAETNAPARESSSSSGIQGLVAGYLMKKVGASVPSANRITLLRDADGDGVPELRSVFLQGLNSPFGMALVGQHLYVANTDALMRFAYSEGATEIAALGEKIADLPAGPINQHWTKNVIASPDQSRLYVTVGSNSNAGENGLENEKNRASVLEIDPSNGQTRVFASGLRNPNGLAYQPETGALWTTVNERDGLGSDLVPDYMTAVKEGGFYGWPYSYFGQHVDVRVQPQNPELVAKSIAPDYALGNHTASLGLAFAQGALLPGPFRNGAFIGQHGSWNRKPLSGYRVIFVSFENGRPSGTPVDVLTGFLSKDGKANGRPVGVAFDRAGALLVADDVGKVIWRVTAAQPQAAALP